MAIVVLLAVVFSGTSHAQKSGERSSAHSAPVTAADVEEWLVDLDADQRSVRVQAEQSLLQAGPTVLQHLPASERLPNETVREAVSRIRDALQQQQAAASLRASMVTLQGPTTLGEAAQSMMQQTGNEIVVPESLTSRELNLSLEGADFWTALGALVHAAGVAFQIESDRIMLQRPAIGEGAPPDSTVTSAGPFRVQGRAGPVKPIFGDPGHRLLPVELTIQAEPRLRPLFLTHKGDQLQAYSTEEGIRLPSFSPESKLEIPFGTKRRDAKLRLNFRVPQESIPAQISLSGELNVEVATSQERFVFEGITAPSEQSKRQGGLTVTMQQARFSRSALNHVLEVRLNVRYDRGGAAFESHRTWVFHHDVRLELANGEVRDVSGGFETTLQADGVVGLVYRFQNVTPADLPLRFVYMAPTFVVTVPVKFELDGIPLTAPTSDRTAP